VKRRYLKRTRSHLLKRSLWQTRLVFWGGAVLVGVFAAVFARMADAADLWFHGLARQYPYLPLMLTPLGMLAVAWLVRSVFPGAEGSGVPQSLAAIKGHHQAIGKCFLTPKIVLGKVLLPDCRSIHFPRGRCRPHEHGIDRSG